MRGQRIIGLLTVCAGLGSAAQAMNYSVPYVRMGLPTLQAKDPIIGNGAVIGQLEVEAATAPNGIDIYGGDPTYGLPGYRAVMDFFDGNPTCTNDPTLAVHGDAVAHIMAGLFAFPEGPDKWGYLPNWVGVAPGAQYYGALFDGGDSKSALLSLNNAMNYLLVTGGVQAVNCSWGADTDNAASLNGNGIVSLLMDEYVGYAGKTGGMTGAYLDRLMVISAGNSGGLLGMPADCFNGITVGALDVVSNTPPFDLSNPNRSPAPRVAAYSAHLPLADGRAGVDVVAPGTDIIALNQIFVQYDATGGVSGVSASATEGSGTSFAAPHVTGEAALLYGVAAPVTVNLGPGIQMIYTPVSARGTVLSTDHKLIKALIINSADKIPGLDSNGVAQATWQPGNQYYSNGLHIVDVPLNYAVGAGQVNANEAYQQYLEVGNRFWDLRTITTNDSPGLFYTYGEGKFTDSNVSATNLFTLTATLVWDRHVDLTLNTDTNDPALVSSADASMSELDLLLQEETAPNVWSNLILSADKVDNIEHLYVTNLDLTATYRLGVIPVDLVDPAAGEQFALAVSFQAIPEPGVCALAFASLLVFCWRRRRARG